MGAVPVKLPDGTTGTVDASDVGNIGEGGKVLSPQEHTAAKAEVTKREAPFEARDVPETWLAGQHAAIRGVGEAFGAPVDTAVTGIASLFGEGAKKSTREYLKGLDDKHPLVSGWMGLTGNVQGAVGAMGVTGGGAALTGLRGAGGVAARAGVAGLENVVQATTHDINEASLGDHAINGDKLVAAAPGRFIMGAALGAGFEGASHVLGKGYRAFASKAGPALEEGATARVGREVGDEASGARIRALSQEHGADIPADRNALAEILGAEQGVQRGRSAATRAGIVDALGETHATEMAGLTARHEGERAAGLRASVDSLEGIERQGADSTLEAMARGGARVEEAELAAGARRAEATGGLQAAEGKAAAARAGASELREGIASAERRAPAEVERVTQHYDALRQPILEEHRAAKVILAELAAEKASNTKALVRAVKDASKQANRELAAHEAEFIATIEARGPTKEQLIAYREGRGPKPPPALGDIGYALRDATYEAQLERKAEEKLGLGASEASTAHIERLKKIGEGLEEAHKNATKHAADIEGTLAKVESQRAHDLAIASRPLPKPEEATSLFGPQPKKGEKGLKVADEKVTSADASVEAARANVQKVEAEGKAAVEKARAGGEGKVKEAREAADKKIAEAREAAIEAGAKFDKKAAGEKSSMAEAHAKQIKKVPEASTKTDVDPLVAGMKRAAPGNQPVVSGNAAIGSLFSALHGHPVVAGIGLASSFAAGRLRGIGNLTQARAMVYVAKQIHLVDEAVREGAALILGATAGHATTRAIDAIDRAVDKHEKLPPFEKVAAQVYASSANPLELERNVRGALGDLSKHAPATYSGALVTTQRANAYLSSILPTPQRDPNSLTPQLVQGTVSDAAQWDFMQAYRTILNPLSIFKDVHDGSVTESQVGALAAVYEPLYGQIREEVNLQKLQLTTPVDYDRAIHVGTLMNVLTDQVLERDFQRLQQQTFKEKAKQGEAVGSKSGASKFNEKMMSQAQSLEGGGPL